LILPFLASLAAYMIVIHVALIATPCASFVTSFQHPLKLTRNKHLLSLIWHTDTCNWARWPQETQMSMLLQTVCNGEYKQKTTVNN